MPHLKIQIFTLLFLIAVALPNVSSAYFTTDQKAVRINENAILYTIDYTFGTEKYDLAMPLGAVRDLTIDSTSPYLGYSLVNGDGEVVKEGTAAGLVLSSSAKLVNGSYHVPRGAAAKFTLMALVTFPKSLVAASDEDYDLALQVTSLPFTMTDADKKVSSGHLNASELQYYITPSIDVK